MPFPVGAVLNSHLPVKVPDEGNSLGEVGVDTSAGMSNHDRSLDFQATTGLHTALRTKPVSYAKDVQGNRDALERAKYRTGMSDARWIPKKDVQQAETDVRFLTKTAWHIGAGYNVGAGFATQHGWDALGTNSGKDAPRVYEYAGLSFKNYTKSSGPFMEDIRKDKRVSGMLDSLKERHDQAVDECEKTLDLINDSMEPVVMELIKSVQGRLTENVDTIEELFMQLADEFLTRIDMAQLQGVWSDYQEQSMLREVWIAEFEEQTAQLEQQRAGLIQASTPPTHHPTPQPPFPLKDLRFLHSSLHAVRHTQRYPREPSTSE